MSEVEKMYRNAGIKPIVRDNAIGRGYYIEHQRVEEYPPFTAEKQLELIKWLANYERFCCWKFKPTNEWVINDDTYMVDGCDIANSDFEECLASWVNYIWQDLTDAERKQIKNILE